MTSQYTFTDATRTPTGLSICPSCHGEWPERDDCDCDGGLVPRADAERTAALHAAWTAKQDAAARVRRLEHARRAEAVFGIDLGLGDDDRDDRGAA